MPVDLDALARKHGGTVAAPATNLDALAAKHGGTATQPAPTNYITAKPEDFTDKPEGSALGRFFTGVARTVLPSTTPSDYIEGPIYAATHPLESAGLLGSAIYQGSADQASKAKEAAGRIVSAPTVGGKVAASSEALGHLGGMVPIIGPAAAGAGEQIAAGDIAGGLGGGLGLIGPSIVHGAVEAARVGGVPTPAAMKANLEARAASRVAGAAPSNVERVNQALAASTNENKVRSARIAPEMVKRGIWNKDLPTLEARAAVESEKAGKNVQAAVAAVADNRTDVMPLVESLERAKDTARDVNDAGQPVMIEPDQVKAIQNLQDTLMDYGDQISLKSLNKVRLKWDEVVQENKGFTKPDVGWKAWAAREGRSTLRDELGKASPDIDKVMHEYSFWQNIEDVAHATNQRRVGQGAGGGLIPAIVGGAGAVALEAAVPGASVAGKVGLAAVGLKGFSMLKRVTSSPGWKMFTAVQRQRIADAVASGNLDALDSAYRTANAARLVGETQAPGGRIGLVGVEAGQPPDEQRANR